MYTAEVKISNATNRNTTRTTVAFCDSGSTFSYIDAELATSMNLPTVGSINLSLSTFGSAAPMTKKYDVKRIILHLKGGKSLEMDILSSDSVVGPMLTARIPTNWRNNTGSLEPHYSEAEPKLLIGADHLDTVIPPANMFPINENLCIIDSEVGPIVRVVETASDAVAARAITAFAVAQDDWTPNLWELEAIGINDKPVNNVEEVKRIFNETYQKDATGRAVVSWPFHDLTGIKPDIGLCKKRLENVQTTMQKQGILEKYDSIINEQQQSGLILEFDPETDPGYHYLPHHAVVNPDKETTKVRGVFDASAKTKDGKSLNDCILSGKPPVNSLAEITLYARCANIIVSSDVQSAFLTVNLSDDSQRYCCFLWLHDPSKPPTRDNLKHFRWVRMPFGVNASPLLLQLVIEKQLDEWSLEHPDDAEISNEIKTKIYVDNVIQCSNSPEEAIEKANKAKTIFEDCKMNLRKFRSNDATVDSKLDGKFAESKLLGIKWTSDDRFEIGWTKDTAQPPSTKRQLLSFAAKPFDPAQLLSPATLPLKFIVQQLWIEKKSWNHPFDRKLQESVDALWMERAGKGISFPRKLFVFKPESTYELQIFADSSGKAYGMAAYILQRTSSQVDTALVFAKSRLAPLKPVLTIPRLELTAVALAAGTIPFLRRALPFTIDNTTIFTDSTTVLHWTKKEPDSDRFVTNRIKKLQEADVEYRYVPTKQNPADIASRGCSPSELMNSELWWTGPRFLHDDPATWPQIPTTDSAAPIASIASRATVIVQHKAEPVIDPSTFSSWLKLTRVTMKIANFWKHAAQSINKDIGCNMTPRNMAENWIIRQIQQQLTLTEKRINELNLFKDVDGIWRQHSRLQHASELPDETKNPILLGHTIETELLVMDIHCRLGHASESMILAELRQRFILPQGRKIIRNTIRRRCMDCRRRKARPFKLPEMPNLPQARISMAEVFQHVGIDYAGPFTVKLRTDDVNQTLKCYICLLTCMSTRAIHLEVVYSASTASFIQALRRFIARRGGPPKTITSDNGSQFKAAATLPELRSFEKNQDVADFSVKEGIQWCFITERAPWKGGFYERLIGLTKTALKASIGRKRPTFEEFSTYVAEAELIVNKRPLTPVSADNSEEIICPACFTTPYSRIQLPNFDLQPDDPHDPTYFPRQTTATDLSELWKKLNANLSKFWLIWRRAYLTELRDRENRQHRSQQKNVDRRPRINEVVIIEDIDKPRHDWTTGRIIEIFDSSDGQCRSARIKTTKGTLINRSVSHLYPLEIDCAGREASHCSDRSEMTATKPADTDDTREQKAASDV